MSDAIKAAVVVARAENVSVGYLLATCSEKELINRARKYNREREKQMERLRESW